MLGRKQVAELQAQGRFSQDSNRLHVLAQDNLGASTRALGEPFKASRAWPFDLCVERVDEDDRLEVIADANG